MLDVGTIGSLKAERQRLLEELKSNPAYRRYRLIGELIKEYGEKSSDALFGSEAMPATVPAATMAPASIPSPAPSPSTDGPPITLVPPGRSGLPKRVSRAERAAALEERRAAHLAETGEELPKRARTPNPDSISAKIISMTAAYLEKTGQRRTSGEILRALMREGLDLGGDRPSTKVSAALTQSPLFNNRRPKGYGLVSWAEDVKVEPIYPETQLANPNRQSEAA